MSPGQPGKFAQACFVGRASGDKERWKHGAAQGGEAAVQRVVRGSGTVWQVRILPDATGAAWVLANFGDVRYSTAIRLEPNLLRQEYGVLEVFSLFVVWTEWGERLATRTISTCVQSEGSVFC
ncbi:hypothetical protein NDU88_001624 [Pleurodeles waltl]|uniref:Uncharacterized protein n=1 Tax=Pleurodeles waltl TaxID=8319 RepID=A0AAV7M1L5_PLEWA|nr:hypothetical protein NDU88_001624 [Pleurodeles waltl]